MIKFNNKYPKIFTHKDTFKKDIFYGSGQYVINKNLELFSNRCPHRGNKIITPGEIKSQFKCGLHGWAWTENGSPLNNTINLKSKNAVVGESGLCFLDWEEPNDSKWVNELKQDTFEYSHSLKKYGEGDWRWQMEMHVDLLHVEQIHPLLNNYVDCNSLVTERGYDWIAQHHSHGWWLFVYPFTHIEYEPGCLYISEMSPRENDQGYDVFIHYLFNNSIDQTTKDNFINMAEVTFDEDIRAVNELSASSKYKMPVNPHHKLEQDIKHFYKWIDENTE
jgi:phenylpropionate dioxygenase-like ring-hydroxylating dioxygenase large terminal subunit